MAPAEQCFILTWKKKSYPWGPFFSMLKFKVHMLGKSTGLPQNDKIRVRSADGFFLSIIFDAGVPLCSWQGLKSAGLAGEN